MRAVTVSAKTVELAVQEALQRLQVGRERVDVLVLKAPSRGFLGIGAKLAQVEVSIVEDPVGDAERFLRELFVTMRLAVKVTTEVSGDQVVFDLSGDRVGLLIGKHGQTLDAIQHLVTAVGNKYASRSVHFVVDAQGYRERRRQQVLYTARKAAEKAVALRREVFLDPMSAAERKIVHLALEGRTDVKTESRGTEPDRKIVIVPGVAGPTGTGQVRKRVGS